MGNGETSDANWKKKKKKVVDEKIVCKLNRRIEWLPLLLLLLLLRSIRRWTMEAVCVLLYSEKESERIRKREREREYVGGIIIIVLQCIGFVVGVSSSSYAILGTAPLLSTSTKASHPSGLRIEHDEDRNATYLVSSNGYPFSFISFICLILFYVQ